MPVCLLQVSGRNFEPRGFLTSATWPGNSPFHDRNRVYVGTIANDPGFGVTVADANIAEQTANAIAFLHQHRDELLRLKSWPSVEAATLQFGWVCPYGLTFPIDHRFPAELLVACGELQIGIEILLYFVNPAEVSSSQYEHL